MMSAPERIWAWPWEVNPKMGQWETDRSIAGEGAEYVRADLPPTLSAALAVPEVAALVEAARLFAETNQCGPCNEGRMTQNCGLCAALAALGAAKP